MKPITREEMYLAAAAGYAVTPPDPVTRKEMFLAKLAGMEVETPAVFTRQERFLDEAAVALSRNVIEPLEVTENGTYTAPDGVDGYSPVVVNVPDPEVVLQDKTITENGTYTADSGYDGLGSVTVEVAGSGEDAAGAPYCKIYGTTSQTRDNTNVDVTVKLYIPKDLTILCAWQGSNRLMNGSAYPSISTVSSLPIEELVIDKSNASYDIVSYTFVSQVTASNTAYNSFELAVMTSTDAMTVNYENGGWVGTLHRSDKQFAHGATYGYRGVAQIMPLKKLNFADGVTEIPNYTAAGQVLLETMDFSGVTKIGDYAFNECIALKSISLSKDLTSIGSSAFYGCTSLTGELVIPSGVTQIPYRAFANTKFDRVVFPAGLTQVGERAFENCNHPTEFDFSACTKVPTMYVSSYLGIRGKGQVLKIPSALFNTWSTATGWKDWAAQMVAV